jgi:uncharacterized protein YndB with AHSA1/START domain
MSDLPRETAEEEEVALDYDLDAPPEKVWRAIAIGDYRDRWLPREDLAEAEPIFAVPGEEIQYRIREHHPPFVESTVTFRIEPGTDGGTRFRIIHRIDGQRADGRRSVAANDNTLRSMLAA